MYWLYIYIYVCVCIFTENISLYYLVISITRVVDAGVAASFNDEFKPWTLKSDSALTFEAMNENALGMHTSLGKIAVSLADLQKQNSGNSATFPIKVTLAPQGNIYANITLDYITSKADAKPVAANNPVAANAAQASNNKQDIKTAAPTEDRKDSAVSGGGARVQVPGPPAVGVTDVVVTFKNLRCDNLVDKGSMIDRQDPCLKITAEKLTFQTKRYSMCYRV